MGELEQILVEAWDGSTMVVEESRVSNNTHPLPCDVCRRISSFLGDQVPYVPPTLTEEQASRMRSRQWTLWTTVVLLIMVALMQVAIWTTPNLENFVIPNHIRVILSIIGF